MVLWIFRDKSSSFRFPRYRLEFLEDVDKNHEFCSKITVFSIQSWTWTSKKLQAIFEENIRFIWDLDSSFQKHQSDVRYEDISIEWNNGAYAKIHNAKIAESLASGIAGCNLSICYFHSIWLWFKKWTSHILFHKRLIDFRKEKHISASNAKHYWW